MRISLLLLLFGLNSISKAQTPCGDSSINWNLVKGNTYLQLIYTDTTNLDSQSLATKILNQVKTTTGVKDVQILAGSIVFNVVGHKLDFKNQGYSWGEVMVPILHPMDFSVSIDVKKGKYRVTVSNCVTYMPGAYGTITTYNWGTDIYNKKGCIAAFGKNNIMTGLTIVRQDMLNTFTLKAQSKKSDW